MLFIMYLVYQNDEQSGPFALEEILEKIAAGNLSMEDFFWSEVENEWRPLSLLLEVPPTEGALASDTSLNPPHAELPYAHSLNENQPTSIVASTYERLSPLLNQGETIVYIAVQKKPLINFSPEVVALTNERIHLFYKHLLRVRCDTYNLKEILNIELKNTLLGSHFTFKSVEGLAFGILYLPKAQGAKLHTLAHEMQEKIRAAKQVKLPNQTLTPLPQFHQAIGEHTSFNHDDALHRLATLKKMLEDELITSEDYEIKKQEMLSKL